MTPVRAAAIVRGDVPGLLRRGMPVLLGISFGDDDAVEHIAGVVHRVQVADDGEVDTFAYYDDRRIGRGRYYGASVTVDYTDPAALYLSLHWLAEKGHPMLWALPTTHGGRVEAWDGLTAWEVAAVLVSVSVGRVARGMGPIVDIRHAHSVVSRVAYVEAGYALCVPGGLVVPT